MENCYQSEPPDSQGLHGIMVQVLETKTSEAKIKKQQIKTERPEHIRFSLFRQPQ
jgi:hypothetical protein